MSMITKCPSCGTTFRVTPQHLQAQRGMVRCGRCVTVFDGFKTLSVQPENARLDAPSSGTTTDLDAGVDLSTTATRPVTSSASAGLTDDSTRHEAEALTSSPLEIVPTTATSEPPPPAIALSELPTLELTPVAAEPIPETSAPLTTESEPETAPVATRFETAPLPRRRNVSMAIGIFALLLALSAQGIYFYRGKIAASVPEARQYLNKMCEKLRCTVALPQQPKSISIEASDLQATDPANPGLIALTATLRNRATIPLGYPALDVVLTNSKENTVARRIFLPAEYVDAGNDLYTGILPSAEIIVKLNIDSGDLGAAGFRLDLLAAPPR